MGLEDIAPEPGECFREEHGDVAAVMGALSFDVDMDVKDRTVNGTSASVGRVLIGF
jgi:hypothetical protein